MTIASTVRRVSICAVGLALLAGCGDDKPAQSTPATTRVVTPSPTWTPPADPAGVRACDAVRKENSTGQAPDYAALKAAVADGAKSTDLGVRVRSQLLGSAIEIATAAKGQPDEIKTSVAVLTAATEMETTCIQARYYRPGTA